MEAVSHLHYFNNVTSAIYLIENVILVQRGPRRRISGLPLLLPPSSLLCSTLGDEAANSEDYLRCLCFLGGE
jgi:hypothetical protein